MSADPSQGNETSVAPGDDCVYERTAAGMAASRDPNTALPRMMKTLLMAVDGKTSVAMFQQLLPNFGDVAALFDALQANGLVAPRSAAPRKATTPRPPLHVVPASAGPAPQVEPHRTTRPAARTFETQLSQVDEADWSRAAAGASTLQRADGGTFDPYRTAKPSRLAGAPHSIVESSRVRDARSAMTNFLFKYRPDVAMEATLMLERLDSTEQMIVSLDEYQRLVASAGRAAVDHIADVRRILAS
jgi:hypothetical protein